ncbi:MAG: DegT/DnrJ/EryC1/StrS family aminotransferase [Chloroflexota bacterium]
MRYTQPRLPEAERACREVLSLPVHPALNQEELDFIVSQVNLQMAHGR